MKVTKQDEKAIKTVFSIVNIDQVNKAEGKGASLSAEEYKRYDTSRKHLQSRFGKQWAVVAKDWMDIQEIKKKDIQKELNERANPL